MTAYIIKRLLQSLGALLFAVTIIFILIHATGNPVTMMLGTSATEEQIKLLEKQFKLDKPIFIQYGSFLLNLLKGRIGKSLQRGRPALNLVFSRFPATLSLAGFALIISVVIGGTTGVFAAIERGSIWDSGVMTATIAGLAIPRFWLGLMLILSLGLKFSWLPVSGRGSLAHFILPGITLAIPSAARLARLVRTSMLEQINKDFIRTARAKGLSEPSVIFKHVLRPGLLSPITGLALEVGALIGHATVIEMVFAWPGIGRLAIQAIWARDYPIVYGFIIFISLLYILVNLLADITYGMLDPRIVYD